MTKRVQPPVPLVLASQSPRRAQLLQQLLGPEWVAGGAAAPFIQMAPAEGAQAEALEAQRPCERPQDYVQRVTLAKLRSARSLCRAKGLEPAWVLCADTTVAVGRRILGKPQDEQQAREFLHAMSGRSHQVHTAVAVANAKASGRAKLLLSSTKVQVATLSGQDIERYLANQEWQGKAGAYAIQGCFAAHVQRIEGSYSGVMGLPLFETAQLLKGAVL